MRNKNEDEDEIVDGKADYDKIKNGKSPKNENDINF